MKSKSTKHCTEKFKNIFNDLHDKENIENMTFDKFLNDVIELTEEEYIKAIRSNLNGPRVFLKRKPCEVRVNPYMKVIPSAYWTNMPVLCILFLT